MAFFQGWVNPLSKIFPSSGVEQEVEDDQLREDSIAPVQNNDRRTMSREPSPEIADLVETMNENAGKSPKQAGNKGQARATSSQGGEKEGTEIRRSPRKRAVSQRPDSSAAGSKRRRTTESQVGGSGLKRRKTPPKRRPSARRGDMFEISDEDPDEVEDQGTDEAGNEEAERPRVQSSPAPVRKQVKRKQIMLLTKTNNPSPMRGRGTIEILTTGEVNLEDSPSKKPAGRPKKLNHKAMSTVNDGKRAEVIPEPTARPGAAGRDASDARRKPTKSTARQKETNNQRPDAAAEPEAQNDDAGDNNAEQATAQPRETRAEEQREREEKREKDRARELKGIETIANLHGCGCDLAWGDLFAAVTELKELKNTAKPESRQGTRLCAEIDWIGDRYRAAGKESEYSEDDELPSMTVDIERLANKIWLYPTNRVNERAKKGRDLYGHVVLELVRLLQKVLRNRQVDGEFDQEVYDEMCSLLEASWNAADLACTWKPRPSQLDNGARRLMRDDVRKNLGFLKEKYVAHRKHFVGTTEEQRLDLVAEVQKRAQEYLWGPVRQRRENIQAKNRRCVQANNAIVVSEDEGPQGDGDDGEEGEVEQATEEVGERRNTRLQAPPSETEVLDNFHVLQKKNQEVRENAEKERINAILTKNRQQPQTTGVVAATKQAVLDIDDIQSLSYTRSETTPSSPRDDRAPTEEIPGPVQPAMTLNERTVFMNLLKHFTGRSRFEQILARYGGPGGHLEGYDLDSLMSQAKLLKEHQISKTREEPQKWEWLTSVP